MKILPVNLIINPKEYKFLQSEHTAKPSSLKNCLSLKAF
jgi:hypothetical protein